MSKLYTTIQDAIAQEIAPALGEFADEYDLEAIAREILVFDAATDEDGTTHLDWQGFRLADIYDEDADEYDQRAFWITAERHTI